MSGRHRWTRAGMKLHIEHLGHALRAEQTKTGRLADQMALQQRDRRLEKEQAARQHRTDRQEINRLQAALKAWEAQWANAHPVSVPAPRDLRSDDDRPTVPKGIDVRGIRAMYPVMPISERQAGPDATSPANIPAT
ncbi:hypothetical protein [Streptomyces cadmiisoli]|uniref:hypothetical protein n=1 Tax=Streptomyces cadmiisoli TaxID=2184053 RepID=UPI00365F7A80